jgi:RNA polymerase sigma factor (sigma-70 family)
METFPSSSGAVVRSPQKTAEVSLEEVPLLSSRDQYISELWRLKRLSPEEEDQFVAQARAGSHVAKNALIESCLGYVLYMARQYAVYLEHDDLLDIVEVGNLAIAEKIDQALKIATGSVNAYLCGVARRSISRYCLYHSRLIPIKHHGTALEAFPQVESLDEGDEIAAKEWQARLTETDPELAQVVRDALEGLTAKQRKVVEMRYGLNADTGALHLQHIAEHLHARYESIKKLHYGGIKKLREKMR